jgi:hypothetical protein
VNLNGLTLWRLKSLTSSYQSVMALVQSVTALTLVCL